MGVDDFVHQGEEELSEDAKDDKEEEGRQDEDVIEVEAVIVGVLEVSPEDGQESGEGGGEPNENPWVIKHISLLLFHFRRFFGSCLRAKTVCSTHVELRCRNPVRG